MLQYVPISVVHISRESQNLVVVARQKIATQPKTATQKIE